MAYIGEIARRDIGSEAGKSLHDALSQLADIKMRQMLQRHETSKQSQAFNQILSNYGYNPEEGQQLGQTIANLPQKTQDSMLRDLINRKQFENRIYAQQDQPSGYQDFMNQRNPSQPDIDSQNIPQQYARAQFTNSQQAMPQQYISFQRPSPRPAQMTENQRKQIDLKERNLALRKEKLNKKKLSNKVVDAFLKKYNNDPEKALKMAKLAGYEV